MRKINMISAASTVSLVAFLVGTAFVWAEGEPKIIDAKSFIDHSLSDCALQQANDQAAVSGGTVRIPAGEYKLRRGLILKSNVVLTGAGQEKTILMPARQVERIDFTKPGPDKDHWVDVNQIPNTMREGSAVVIWPSKPWPHAGHLHAAWVEQIDRENKRLKLKFVYGFRGHQVGGETKLAPGADLMSFGDALSLDRDVKKGDTEIVLKDSAMLQAGDEIAVGEPGNDSRDRQRFVREVKGNTIVLTEPVALPLEAWQGKAWESAQRMPYALHPLIHGWDVKNAAIRDLTIKGYDPKEIHATQTRYTLSGIHLFNSKNVTIENVTVKDWPADGISLQVAEGDRVVACVVSGCAGNGFHPGTGSTDMLFENNLSSSNGAGLYFCWSNAKNHIVHNKFVKNRWGGITGLGNPHDQNNLIEDNLIAENGGPGIEINGGLKSGNVIRNNTIENNSKATPGKYPGILVSASVEDARNYTVEGNTIRDTQSEKTQWVGIEEKNSVYNKQPTAADENIFRNNHYAGHQTADIIKAGSKTTITEADSVKVIAAKEPATKP